MPRTIDCTCESSDPVRDTNRPIGSGGCVPVGVPNGLPVGILEESPVEVLDELPVELVLLIDVELLEEVLDELPVELLSVLPDMRTRDPEKEDERPSASRAPTHNAYEELPASQKPHNVAATWGSST